MVWYGMVLYGMGWDGEGKRGAHSGRASAARNLCCLLLLRPISAKTTAIMIGATFAAAAATHAIWPRCHGRRGEGQGQGLGPPNGKGQLVRHCICVPSTFPFQCFQDAIMTLSGAQQQNTKTTSHAALEFSKW